MNDTLLISVLGIGTYGTKALHMIMDKMQKNDQDDTFITAPNSNEFAFYAIDNDKDVLNSSNAQDSLLLSDELNQESLADQQVEEKLRQMVGDSDFVILVSAIGGNTSSMVIAAVADRLNAMKIPMAAVVVKPFDFEGQKRINNAEIAISKLEKLVTTLKVLNNNEVIAKTDNQPLKQLFAQADSELVEFVLSFSEKHFIA
ncbi:Cell division protein FtsZ [uncultured Avibacterium sp.]|uniref:Cell division protein FtsZ n=1 Tax=uncultured Avibacterium sp. TaxID=1936169 RepID=A0A486XEG0_9PAST|nr:Cell division protein FtsZ [uncultured Avibacterium sp.]